LNEIAEKLHISRDKASKGFADAIQSSIRSLELERSVFGVKLLPQEISSSGKDAVLFVFSATGSNPVDVAKCASGGEMSRIMLCLKAMMAKYTNMPTMIFDEIDTGVSGSVADKMGSKICEMGRDMQVFAITHLPQVAAKGQVHLLVTKTFNQTDGSASTTIKQLDSSERVNELARMLSGSTITAAAIANAKSLLSSN
jgi:DNA repair protein RecN (Recombination protein N)